MFLTPEDAAAASSVTSQQLQGVPNHLAGMQVMFPRHEGGLKCHSASVPDCTMQLVQHASQKSPADQGGSPGFAKSWAFSIISRARAAEAAAMNDAASYAASSIWDRSDKLASLTKGLGLGLEKMNPQFRLEFDKKAAWLIKEEEEMKQAAATAEQQRIEEAKHPKVETSKQETAEPVPPGVASSTVAGGQAEGGSTRVQHVTQGGQQGTSTVGAQKVVQFMLSFAAKCESFSLHVLAHKHTHTNKQTHKNKRTHTHTMTSQFVKTSTLL